MPLRLRAAALATAAFLGAIVALSFGLRIAHAGAVLPGVTVAGVDIGGLDEPAAHARLTETVGVQATTAFSVRAGETVTTMTPADAGYRIDIDATVARALAVGRSGNPVGQGWRQVAALWRSDEVDLATSADPEALTAHVEVLAGLVDRAPTLGDLVADGERVEAIAPEPGVSLDRAAAASALRSHLSARSLEELSLPVVSQPPVVDIDDLIALAASVEAALPNGVTLIGDGNELALSGRDLGAILGVTTTLDGSLQLMIEPDGLSALVGDRAEVFEQVPVDASFDLPRAPPTTFDVKDAATWEPVEVTVGIEPSRPGRAWDPVVSAQQVAEMLTTGVDTAAIRLVDVEADLTAVEAQELGITHLLGTFTTYHACCQSRVHNIQLLADMVDGAVVLPGEQFSVNQISQVRECSKGFQEAGMIFNGELVDSCGGGVSQFGTTMFNAAFFAGMQLDSWKAHSFYISRYPMGREATLNYPSPDIDVRFTNATGHGLLVRTSYTTTSITVSLFGQSDVASVTAQRSEPYAARSYGTIRRQNAALAPGTQKQVQSGANGFSVTVTRKTAYRDGRIDDFEFVTTYLPKNVIIEFGPASGPSPSPSATPSPSPSPTPSNSPSPEPTPTPTPSSSPSSEPSPNPSGEPSSQPSPDPTSTDPTSTEPTSSESARHQAPPASPTGAHA